MLGIQSILRRKDYCVNRDQMTMRFRVLLIFSGVFNIVLAAPLIVPELYRHYFALLWNVNSLLSLGGREPIAPSEGINALLINTAGIDLVLIGVFVLYSARAPLLRWFIPATNAAGRTMFAGIILYYVLVLDIARIVLVIGIIDILISGAFIYYLFALRSFLGVGSAAQPPVRADVGSDAAI